MRSFAYVLLLFGSLMLAGCGGGEVATNQPAANAPAATKPATGKQPVLVELFTSEGCGNCPPADRQLAFLETQQPVQDADVITLGYHVDYFNDRGWKDAYSSADHTRRQQLYAMRMQVGSVYTPQMVVDGQSQFVGSDAGKANEWIKHAAAVPKPTMEASVNGNKADVSFTGFGRHSVATVVLAAAEDGLTSSVKAGNNAGKTLQHISVVRKLVPFGKVPERATEFRGTVELPSDAAWKKENVRYVVYVQEDQSGKIIAAGRLQTP